MGLFKNRSKAINEGSDAPVYEKKKKRFSLFKSKGQNTPPPTPDEKVTNPSFSPSNQTLKTLQLSESPKQPIEPKLESACVIDENGFPIEDVQLPAGIPESISAWAPNGAFADLGLEDQRGDEDSLGSPISKCQRRQTEVDEGASSLIPLDPVDSSKEPAGVDIHNPPSIQYLSYYISALSRENSPDPSSDPSSRALRSLFTLSEHASSHKDRVAMVHWTPTPRERSAALVPALLDFLKRCKRETSEQYLAMLVLNNVSIPHENKRCIALDFGGVKALSSLLCQDPECHLLVIILVNLTFCEAKLRQDLLTYTEDADNNVARTRISITHGPNVTTEEPKVKNCGGDTYLVEALTYTILLCSLSNEQLASLPPIQLEDTDGTVHTPRKLLNTLTYSMENMGYLSNPNANLPPIRFDGTLAETARWSLCALKNLSRPDQLAPSSIIEGKDDPSLDSLAAYALIDTGVLPLLLRIIRFDITPAGGGSSSNLSWSLNSAQDAALFTLLHLASVPEVRGKLKEYGCISGLTSIVEYGKANKDLNDLIMGSYDDKDTDNLSNLGLQSMKARIASSYLLEAMKPDASVLADHETQLLIEVLSNCLHSRPKDGPGGYSSFSFSLKMVLYSIRCLMGDCRNILVFAKTFGARLNVLLLKALAQYSFSYQQDNSVMDEEAAEHSVVCLYLMSSHGFHVCCASLENYPFLPAQLGQQQEAVNALVKTLVMYSNVIDDSYSAGRHAALQLLLRTKYLRYSGSAYEDADGHLPSDFEFDDELIGKLNEAILAERQIEGAPPSSDIFQRSVVRYHRPTNSIVADPCIFPNVLGAVQGIVFSGISLDIHSGVIDEVEMANNIVNVADGLNSTAYGYAWRWESENEEDARFDSIIDYEQLGNKQDEVSEMERSNPYTPRRKGFFGRLRFHGDEEEPFTIFGLRCGTPVCGR